MIGLQSESDIPVIPMPEVPAESPKEFWTDFKGLSFDEILAKLTDGMISFASRIVLAFIIFYVGRYIIRKLYSFVYRTMTGRSVDASLTTFTLSLVKMLLYFILIITVIGVLGIETSSFLAIFASAGVAIGMALSGTLQNFAGGVLILLLKPYKVGDFIEVQGFSGTVKSIQLFNTVINTPDNKAIILPNGSLSTSSINNFSLEPYRRVDWDISLAYGTDLAKAKEEILKILLNDTRIVKETIEEDQAQREAQTGITKKASIYAPGVPVELPGQINRAPFVALKEMADSAIILTVRAWTEASNYWSLYFDINQTLYTKLPELGFSFPFPQIDVHIQEN